MEPNKRKSLKIWALVIVATLAAVFFVYQNKSSLPDFKNLLNNGQSGEILETIKREVSNPGALISRIESAQSYLTKVGVFNLTNFERNDFGLRILTSSAKLDEIAKRRLNDMFSKQYFEHVSPSGESASTEAESVGYEYLSIGENIALGNFENDVAVVEAWMNSPGHRANILSTKFTELGIAVGKGEYQGRNTWMAVQIFAKPLSFCGEVDSDLKIKIENIITIVDDLRVRLGVVEAQLEELSKNKRQNREAYKEKVAEYNALAKEVNQLNAEAKVLIEQYNFQVKEFNICLESE